MEAVLKRTAKRIGHPGSIDGWVINWTPRDFGYQATSGHPRFPDTDALI